jgi:glycosyltransferase involved in cell wall biosynthesis
MTTFSEREQPSIAAPADPLGPTISAVVGAYNAEEHIGETIQSILAQTRPADEIIIVDDGSTDGTLRVLGRFGDQVRVIRRPNGGCPAAFNTAFSAATSDYVAMCGADDLWEPTKLERQAAALDAHPEIDLAFAGSWSFGFVEAPWPDPPGQGILDNAALLELLFRENILCASSALIRRSLYERLGPFVEDVDGERFACDDYEYWLRSLGDGAVFYYEPGTHVRYRRHAGNATNSQTWVCRSRLATHRMHVATAGDEKLVATILANDLRVQARYEIVDGTMRRARTTFMRSLRHERNVRAAAFVALLSLPEASSRRLIAGWEALRPSLIRLLLRGDKGAAPAAAMPPRPAPVGLEGSSWAAP